MLVKLHMPNGRFAYVNPEFIVEVLEYKPCTDPNGEPTANSTVVLHAAGHCGVTVDALETPEQIAELCNPVLSAIDKTKNSVKGCFSKIFKSE